MGRLHWEVSKVCNQGGICHISLGSAVRGSVRSCLGSMDGVRGAGGVGSQGEDGLGGRVVVVVVACRGLWRVEAF